MSRMDWLVDMYINIGEALKGRDPALFVCDKHSVSQFVGVEEGCRTRKSWFELVDGVVTAIVDGESHHECTSIPRE